MKRTLLAVGVAVLVSMMFVPVETRSFDWWGFVLTKGRLPFFITGGYWAIMWRMFILQTVFLAILAAVIVNIPWRRKPKPPLAS